MYREMAGYKKGLRGRVGMLVLYIFLLLLSLCIAIFLEQIFCYLLALVSVVMIFWTVNLIRVLNKNYAEMATNTAIAKERIEKYTEELKKNAFVVSKHISAFGHKFIEYRNDFAAPDNIHLWIDGENKRLAFAELLEDHFKIFDYSDIISVDMIKDVKQVGTRDMLTVLIVQFTLKDDNFMYGIPVNDNQGFYLDTQEFASIIKQAEELVAVLNSFKEMA